MENVNPAGTNKLGIESEIVPGSATPIGNVVESMFITAVMIKNTRFRTCTRVLFFMTHGVSFLISYENLNLLQYIKIFFLT